MTTLITLRMPTELLKAIDALARVDRRSRTSMLLTLLDRALALEPTLADTVSLPIPCDGCAGPAQPGGSSFPAASAN